MKIQSAEYKNTYPVQQQASLTAEQKDTLQEILSNYNPENFSRQDKLNLMRDLKETGIPKDIETAKIIKDMGFNNLKSKTTTGISDKTDDQLITPQIISLFKQHGAGEISEEEFHSKIEKLKQNHFKPAGNLINKST